MNTIDVSNVNKCYFPNTTMALENISFQISEGSFTAIIGRNGAGKTTILKAISGLTNIDSGEIKISISGNTLNITDVNNKFDIFYRRKIGIIFQNMALWPHMTVIENVTYPLVKVHMKSEDEAFEQARVWLKDKLGVSENNLDKFPQQLSIGMQRRVAIGRTLATDPDILLIDELEANLDPEAIQNVLNLIRDIYIKDPKKTVLMVTHQINFFRSYASQVLVLDNGKLVGNGYPKDLLDNPPQETVKFIREVVEPQTSQQDFTYRCLESAVNITSQTVSKRTISNTFQYLAKEVNNLLLKLEPASPHLVLIVTRDFLSPKQLIIRGASISTGFELDGKNVEALGPIIDNKSNYRRISKNFEKLLAAEKGVLFETGDDLNGSLIAMMIKQNNFKYVYADGWPPIDGPHHTEILPYTRKPKEGTTDASSYYEFSSKTKNVYLFPMELESKAIGVLSIDTYSSVKWFPFIVEQLLLVAKLGAIVAKPENEKT